MALDPAAKFREWRDHPGVMVRELFGVQPDPWQDEVLEAFPHKQRIALLASKGVGKTCLLAWLGWNFLLTRPQPSMRGHLDLRRYSSRQVLGRDGEVAHKSPAAGAAVRVDHDPHLRQGEPDDVVDVGSDVAAVRRSRRSRQTRLPDFTPTTSYSSSMNRAA